MTPKVPIDPGSYTPREADLMTPTGDVSQKQTPTNKVPVNPRSQTPRKADLMTPTGDIPQNKTPSSDGNHTQKQTPNSNRTQISSSVAQTPTKANLMTPIGDVPQQQTPASNRTQKQTSASNRTQKQTPITSRTPGQTPTSNGTPVPTSIMSSDRLEVALSNIQSLLESHKVHSTTLIDAYTTACHAATMQHEQVSRCHSALADQHEVYLHVMQQNTSRGLWDLQEKVVAEAQEQLEKNMQLWKKAGEHQLLLSNTVRNNLDHTLFQFNLSIANIGKQLNGKLTPQDWSMLSNALNKAQSGLQSVGSMIAVGEQSIAAKAEASAKGSPSLKTEA